MQSTRQLTQSLNQSTNLLLIRSPCQQYSYTCMYYTQLLIDLLEAYSPGNRYTELPPVFSLSTVFLHLHVLYPVID